MTNSIHRITWKNKFTSNEIKAIGISSLTSLAQISFELEGRSYGGGVLKIEPSNALNAIVPKYPTSNLQSIHKEINILLRNGKKNEAIKLSDDLILENYLGLKSEFTDSLRKSLLRLTNLRHSSTISSV